MSACLDSHVLLWWALDPEKLSDQARDYCQRMTVHAGCVSAISIWELGLKVKNGHLDIGISIEEFTRRIKRTGEIEIVPVDETVWMKNQELEWDHRDPADRTIVATAILRGVPLLTKDEAIRSFAPAKAIW